MGKLYQARKFNQLSKYVIITSFCTLLKLQTLFETLMVCALSKSISLYVKVLNKDKITERKQQDELLSKFYAHLSNKLIL